MTDEGALFDIDQPPPAPGLRARLAATLADVETRISQR